ncbi:hypothetical protein DFS33DRAFT_521825 [Desarmillaria ectypa]|nr:hypothetical protein DFS33DRAFT_521825 [Desarmillaria ectypa]
MALFPQEIIDAVIDEVQDSSPSSYRHSNLSCCSLVCRSFLPRCRKHLFSSISLTSEGRHSWNKFHDRVFKASPEIMWMISSVALSSGDERDAEEEILCTLLTAMCNLRHIELSSGFQGSAVLSALRSHANSIISFRFTDIIFQDSAKFFDFIATFPNLRFLSIKDLDYKERVSGMAVGRRYESPRRLESLYFHTTSYTRIAAFRELVDQGDISHCLRQCGLSLWDRDDIMRAKVILNDSFETLDNLHLIYNTQINFCDILDILDFNLFDLPHLSITTFLPPNFRYTDLNEFEQGITRCVLDEQLALEELTLRIYPNENCAIHNLWKVLDASLSGPRFPQFRRLTIELIHSDRGLTNDGMTQTIERQFTALNERDGVQISCTALSVTSMIRFDMYTGLS